MQPASFEWISRDTLINSIRALDQRENSRSTALQVKFVNNYVTFSYVNVARRSEVFEKIQTF